MSVLPWNATLPLSRTDEATTERCVDDDAFGLESSAPLLALSPSLPIEQKHRRLATVLSGGPWDEESLTQAPEPTVQYTSPVQRPGLRKLRSDEDPYRGFRLEENGTADKGNQSMDSSNGSEAKENALLGTTPSHQSTPTLLNTTTVVPSPNKPVIEVTTTSLRQLVVGALGIYATYLYYGHVQEDLFRYRNPDTGQGFEYFWALQMLESLVTMMIGYMGRTYNGNSNKGLPLAPFFKSGASQLTAKALMSMSLAAGLSFPVVTLAKSAKIVPVMLGQFLLGGSTYAWRDYTFAILIVVGTALLSAGKTTRHHNGSSDTLSGLILILLSLVADGFTGGLQKKLKQVTATMAPTTYDFLYYSHMAQLVVAGIISAALGELHAAPGYLVHNPSVQWLVVASCVCSAVGQCFIFYVISCFDPLVCTTITTTRKMFTVLLSIGLKGHILSSAGCLGLGLACTALLVEVEGKVAAFRRKLKKDDPLRKPLLSTTSSASL